MTTLTIRNLDDEIKSLLRIQTAQQGCSMEQEVRDILRRALRPESTEGDFVRRVHQNFAGLEADTLPIPRRRPACLPESSNN